MHASSNAVATAKPIRILLIGATGFIGSHVLDALHSLTISAPRLLVRQDSVARLNHGFEAVPGSIIDKAALLRAMEGMDCVINAASYLGSDPVQSRAINSIGARMVLEACAKHDIDRVVHISTTAVYGSGPHIGVPPEQLDYAPESLSSTTRAEGDRIMLGGGACCIRPNLVLGEGDRWVMPSLRRIMSVLNGLIEGGGALLSTIEARDLGVLIAAAATHPDPIRGALHASYKEPVVASTLFRQACVPAQEDYLDRSVPIHDAIRRLKLHGFTEHQVRMIGQTHWYDSEEIWTYAAPLIPTACVNKD